MNLGSVLDNICFFLQLLTIQETVTMDTSTDTLPMATQLQGQAQGLPASHGPITMLHCPITWLDYIIIIHILTLTQTMLIHSFHPRHTRGPDPWTVQKTMCIIHRTDNKQTTKILVIALICFEDLVPVKSSSSLLSRKKLGSLSILMNSFILWPSRHKWARTYPMHQIVTACLYAENFLINLFDNLYLFHV